MVTDKVAGLMNGQTLAKYDVIRINSGLTSLQKIQERYLMVFKAPPEIIYTGLQRTIGTPEDINSRASSNNFNNKNTSLEIPVRETN